MKVIGDNFKMLNSKINGKVFMVNKILKKEFEKNKKVIVCEKNNKYVYAKNER